MFSWVSYAERLLNQPRGRYIFKQLHSFVMQTVEPRYNGPPYNEVLGVTTDFLYPSNSKTCEKDPQHDETALYSEQILPVPWPCVITRSHRNHLLIAILRSGNDVIWMCEDFCSLVFKFTEQNLIIYFLRCWMLWTNQFRKNFSRVYLIWPNRLLFIQQDERV